MRFEFETPSVVDASDHKADATGRAATASFKPHVRQGQQQIFVGYLHALGDKGAKAISRVMFNPRSGKFQVQDLTAPAVECEFDKDPAVLEAGRKKPPAAKPPSKPAPNPVPAPAPVAMPQPVAPSPSVVK